MQDAEPYDWQSPEVTDRVVETLSLSLTPWFHAHDIRTDAAEMKRLKISISTALAYAGEKADGYQMARWLEDSRSWPADVELVGHLRHVTKLRTQIIAELEEARRPKPKATLYWVDNIQIGLKFRADSSSTPLPDTVWQVIEKERTTALTDSYKVQNVNTGRVVTGVEGKLIIEYLLKHGPQ